MEKKELNKWDIARMVRDKSIVLSHSSFNEFCKSPNHFIAYKLKKKETTAAMAFGTMVHCLILEPDEFDIRFAVAPKVDRRTKIGKQTWIEFVEMAGEKTVVTEEDFETASRIKEAVYRNESSRFILDNVTEMEGKSNWEFEGYKWRGVRDMKGDNFVADLKVVADANPRKLYYKIYEMGYHRQAFHYTNASGLVGYTYYIVAVDRKCNVTVYEIPQSVIAKAGEEIDNYITKMKRCAALDEWDKSYDFYAPNGIYQLGIR